MVGKTVDALTGEPAGPPAGRNGYAAPATATERMLAEVLADIVHVERVSIDSNFFDDLGADSMVMARFCARVRKRDAVPSISMKDIYRHPTIRSLAPALTAAPAPVASPVPEATKPPVPEATTKPAPAGTQRHFLCGTLQLLTFLSYSYLGALIVGQGYEWISHGQGVLGVYVRSLAFSGAAFIGLCSLPIAAKWVLIGRWKPQRIRVWSMTYLRFWIVKTLIRTNPLLMVIGGRSRTSTSSPLYLLYLRALGAKIGRNVAIFTRHVPVCTDLLTIGDGTVIRKDAYFNCYRARDGFIETGPVTLGRDAVVGEMAVLDIETSMGDGAQLGHASALHPGQAVPDGERWHGVPAQPTTVDYRFVGPAACGAVRRAAYGTLQLLSVLLVYLPLAISGVVLLLTAAPELDTLMGSTAAITSWRFYTDAMIAAAVLLIGLMFLALLFASTVPRLLHLAIKPGKTYRLYGFHYGIHRMIAHWTNIKFFNDTFGDSSCIVHYLRCIGYRLDPVVQTGCNFGMEVRHENPFLSHVGSGTMAADALSIMNADFSNTSFRVSRVSIGKDNFLGNQICYPAEGRTGDNCLLATKLMVPVDGEVRENTGLLGAPSFAIPRSVQRDTRFDHLKQGDELRRRLAAKNRYDTVTIGLRLLARWIHFFVLTLIAWTATDLYDPLGAPVIALGSALGVMVSVVYFALVERIYTRLRPLRPRYCSIYDPYFWSHERYWKLSYEPKILDGTPFKILVWRFLGARIGKRVLDDGCNITEKALATIGDDVTLNAGARAQCHSQEDGTFKSDHITIGAGCTIGINSLVHYGTTMGDGAELGTDSFLMKGEEIPPRARWSGNPAREMRLDHQSGGSAGTPLPLDGRSGRQTAPAQR